MINRDELRADYEKLCASLSMQYIKIAELLDKEEEAKKNGEEYDEEFLEKALKMLVHINHATGEVVESKAALFTELSLADMLCKAQYESEINEALENFLKVRSFEEILNEDDKGKNE